MIRQFFSESTVITIAAVLLAALLVELSLPWFRNLSSSELTWSLLAHPLPILILAGVVLISSALAGGYAAFYLTSFQPAHVLKSSRVPISRGVMVRRFLVGFQFALSIALILATLTVRKQHQFMMHQELGFDQEQILYLPMQSQQLIGHAEDMRDRIIKLPGVASASVVSRVFGKISGGVWRVKSPAVEQAVAMNTVFTDWDFIETMGLELIEGRPFSREFPSDTETAFILNEKAAQKLKIDWNGDRQVELPDTREGEVVGVVKDFHFQSLYFGNNALCLTFIRNDYDRRFIAVRTLPGQMTSVVHELEQIWSDVDPALPFDIKFLDQELEAQYRSEQRLSNILSWLTGFTLLVALMGLFALSTFLTEQRTKEIGIRKVLGASVPTILFLLARDFARPVLLANLLAWPATWWFINNWLQDYLYRIEIPWWSFLGVSILVLLVAEGTVALQALRTAHANPIKALRYE